MVMDDVTFAGSSCAGVRHGHPVSHNLSRNLSAMTWG
jgi:hypothetical protein